MECAMEQLGLYTTEKEKEKKKYDSVENQKSLLKGDGIKACVYEYTKPANDKTTYSQIQLYYSRFYLDEKIKEYTELCSIFSASHKKLKKDEISNKEKKQQYNFTWYVKAPGHPQKYIHYSFDKQNGSGEQAGEHIIEKILTKLKEKNRTTNNPVYAFYTAKRTPIHYRIFFFQQEDKEIDEKYDRIEVVRANYRVISFKTFNPTKSELGIHSEIFRVLLNSTIISANKEVLS